MRVFIRTDELTNDKPTLIAFYPDDSSVADDAHGEGMTVLTLPREVIQNSQGMKGGMPHLAADWRKRAGSVPIEAEAMRRIEESFPLAEQVKSMHDVIDIITKHGADMSKWPADVRQRKAAYDEKLKYVADVMDKARANTATMPHDPGSDKIWPRRPTKKV